MTYATNLWYAALWAEDLPEGALESRTVCEQPIVFFRGPLGEPVSQVGAIVLAKLRKHSTTDYAD